MERIELAVRGMSCGHCVAAVRRALEQQPGADVEAVTIGTARVAYDPDRLSPAALVSAVEAAGYPATVVEPRA